MLYLSKKSAAALIALFLSLSVPAACGHCKDLYGENLYREEGPKIALSLGDAIDTAVRNNRDIQIQKQQIEYARANLTAALGKFLPDLSISYGFMYNDSVFYSDSFPNHRKDTRIYSGFKSNNQLALAGKQMIYDGGASIANLKQARINLKMQEENLRFSILDVEYQAKNLYYSLLLAYENMRIAQDLVDQSEAHYEVVLQKFQQGTASRFDVLQSKVQISKTIPNLIQAENSVETNANNLKKLLYLDMASRIRPKEKLSYSLAEIRLKEFLNEAYANNPQLKSRNLGIELQKWAIEYAKSGWYPNINATANYSYTSDKIVDMINPRHDLWNMGITATNSIFDGMATKAQVDQAKARYQEAVLEKDNTAEQIGVDVRQGCLDMKLAHTTILAQKDSLEEAKEALRIAYISYDNGVMINLDVIDSQVSLAQVENSLALAVYNYIIAQASLEKVLGREYLSDSENKIKGEAYEKK